MRACDGVDDFAGEEERWWGDPTGTRGVGEGARGGSVKGDACGHEPAGSEPLGR